MSLAVSKSIRHKTLLDYIDANPFLKDDELAKLLNVSVGTIRIDRAELGIAEYRERIKNLASKTKQLFPNTLGDVVDINLFHDGISILDTDDSMTYEGTNVVKGQVIFAFAEDLAMSVINAKFVLITVANVKYKKEVLSGQRLVARYEVIRNKNSEYIIWVKIKVNSEEVFRTKFKLELRKSISEEVWEF